MNKSKTTKSSKSKKVNAKAPTKSLAKKSPKATRKQQNNMKKVVILVAGIIAGLAAFAVVSMVLNKEDESKKTEAPKTETITQPEKKVFVSTKHGFKATFPTTPSPLQQDTEVEGVTVPTTIYLSSSNLKVAYFVSVAEYPAGHFDTSGDIKPALKAAVDGMVESYAGTLKRSSFTTFGSHQAIDAVIEGTQDGERVTARVRNIFAGQRLYSILTIGVSEADHAAFVKSFSLQ